MFKCLGTWTEIVLLVFEFYLSHLLLLFNITHTNPITIAISCMWSHQFLNILLLFWAQLIPLLLKSEHLTIFESLCLHDWLFNDIFSFWTVVHLIELTFWTNLGKLIFLGRRIGILNVKSSLQGVICWWRSTTHRHIQCSTNLVVSQGMTSRFTL